MLIPDLDDQALNNLLKHRCIHVLVNFDLKVHLDEIAGYLRFYHKFELDPNIMRVNIAHQVIVSTKVFIYPPLQGDKGHRILKRF